MKKVHSRTSLSNVQTVHPQQRRQNANILVLEVVCCLLSHVIVDANADSFPRILLVPNVVLNS